MNKAKKLCKKYNALVLDKTKKSFVIQVTALRREIDKLTLTLKPFGLKRKSNRFYDKNITENNYPRCYGCEDKDDKDCCEKQKNNLKGPDYKYKNDEEDRRLSKFY